TAVSHSTTPYRGAASAASATIASASFRRYATHSASTLRFPLWSEGAAYTWAMTTSPPMLFWSTPESAKASAADASGVTPTRIFIGLTHPGWLGVRGPVVGFPAGQT